MARARSGRRRSSRLATGTFTDASTQDLTSAVTWSRSDGGVVVVSNALGTHGLATAIGTGVTSVTASLGAVSDATTFTTTDALLISIAITPDPPSTLLGLTLQLTATGFFTDGSSQDLTTAVTWASGNGAIVIVLNVLGQEGQALGLTLGSAQVTATLGAVSGATTFQVTL